MEKNEEKKVLELACNSSRIARNIFYGKRVDGMIHLNNSIFYFSIDAYYAREVLREGRLSIEAEGENEKKKFKWASAR